MAKIQLADDVVAEASFTLSVDDTGSGTLVYQKLLVDETTNETVNDGAAQTINLTSEQSDSLINTIPIASLIAANEAALGAGEGSGS